MRSFLLTIFQLLFSLAMYSLCIVFFAVALAPGVYVFLNIWQNTLALAVSLRCIWLGFALAAGYFLFGFTLILIAGLIRTVFRLRLKEGKYPIFSPQGLKWAFVSALYLMINFTFIDFILLTPFANLLQRLL